MSIQLDHIIIWASDRAASSRFLAEMMGLAAPIPLGPFEVVEADGVSLAFMAAPGPIAPQHYAFLVGEAEFDATFDRIREHGLPFWADPYHHRPGEINCNDGGRGVYFEDPDGHDLEIITRRYGGGTS